MPNNTENTLWLELPGDAIRQYIDASAAFSALENAREQAAQVRGGMYWHKGPPHAPQQSYLVRTSTVGAERSLGPRSPETEQVYASFMQRKMEVQARSAGLRQAVKRHRRLNRALHVGRVPKVVVELLNRLAACQMGEHLRVVGTHALYAYEAAAGIRFDGGAVATRDTDLLWDVRRRMAFATALSRIDSSMLGILRKVDPTFRVRDSQKYTAANKDGFEVDIIRREQVADEPHTVGQSDREDDFWEAQAPRAKDLLDATPFSAVIIATSGEMARMNTLEPWAFAQFKRWMSALEDRDPVKKWRDALQAQAVEHVVREYLPQWDRSFQ